MCKRKQILRAIGCATIKQGMGSKAQEPQKIPLPVRNTLAEGHISKPGKWQRDKNLRKHSMAVTAMDLQFQNFIMNKHTGKNIEIRNRVGNGADGGGFKACFFTEGKLAQGSP